MDDVFNRREGRPPSLAAGLNQDGTIHIYVNGEDSGLSIGLDADGTTLTVRVEGSKRVIEVRGK